MQDEVNFQAATSFVKDLWAIAPKDNFIEIIALEYPPGDTDSKLTLNTFIPVEEFLSKGEEAINFFRSAGIRSKSSIHPSVNPRFQRGTGHGGAGTNDDVSHFVALWIDTDDKEHSRSWVDGRIEGLEQEGIGPHTVIESGNGRHFYWFLDKPYPKEVAEPILIGLRDEIQGDDCVSPKQMMRLPGTQNLKDASNPKECYVSMSRPYSRYSLEKFQRFGTGYEFKSDTEPPKGRELEELKLGVKEGRRDHAIIKLAGHYIGRGLSLEEVERIMLEWNQKCEPPAKAKEVRDRIKRIWDRDKTKKEKNIPKTRLPGFNEDGEFKPSIMADHFIKEYSLIATPIGDGGRGTRLYRYDNGQYRGGAETLVAKETDRVLSLASCSTPHRIDQVIQLLLIRTAIEYDKVNGRGNDLINCKNGMVDWRTGKILPHDPAHLSITQVRADYDPQAKSPELDDFFNQIFRPDCIDLVEEFIGYLLLPYTAFHKSFVAVGSGGNGKGTFLKILENLIGTESVSKIPIHAFEENRFAASGLFGKLVNLYHDLDPKILQSTGKFKCLVSGDPIEAERKFKDMFSFVPFARLVFSANEFPRSLDKTEAYFDRLIFVEFPNRFRGTEKCILNYDDILCNKKGFMSALLNRALTGLMRLMDNGRFSIPESSKKILETYKRECSSAYDFVKEFTQPNPMGFIVRSQMYQTYRSWCADSGVKPMSNRNFYKAVRETGAKDSRSPDLKRKEGFSGIDWSNGEPQTAQSELDSFKKSVESSYDF